MTPPRKILGAVVPAAGLSRRMGREKILLPFGRSTILETVLETLAAAHVRHTVAVVRPDLPEAAGRARRAGARAVVNPHPEQEMLVSIRLGVKALPPDLDAFFVWPADHPLVRVETLRQLAAHASPRRVLIPVFGAARGHPALVGSALRKEIEELELSGGLRALWRRHGDVVREIPVDDPGVLANIDTPEAYEKALKRG